MSEMLGNRYFIARQFNKAAIHLERALQDDPDSIKIKKKLIICYIQTGAIKKALHYFYNIVIKDPQSIINTDPYYDDCPCSELIPEWEQQAKKENFPQKITLILGILYLYCDLDKSIFYLQKSTQNHEHYQEISAVIKKLTTQKNEFE
ncbi:MAG: tetratricopeptide repeat protein [Caldithrix sp.]|nr:tetratricopeptide repeat protein [Caldithrix sp.]